jgi:1-acyl-sn-glycerol-3-phosphate acyltransferase
VTDPGASGGRQIGPHLLGVTVTWRYRVQWVAVRILVRTLFRMEVEGLEHWPKAPFQITANHHSGWDPFLIHAVSPFRPRVTWFGPKEVDFSKGTRNRVMGFFGGMIPFNPRKTNLPSAVRAVQRVFDAGGVLAITPEGTLGFRETELLPLQEGATLFALVSGVPIVPCAVVGSSTLWFRKRITVRFGEPIPVVRGVGRDERHDLTRRVEAGILALLPKEEPTYPIRRPGGDWLSDLFNGKREAQWRQAYMAEVDRTRVAEHGSD